MHTEEKSIQPAVLRLADMIPYLNLGRSAIYHLRKDPDFPTPIRLGQRAVGWKRSEVDAWIESRSRSPLPAAQDERASAGQ